jgi:hypothetical protein
MLVGRWAELSSPAETFGAIEVEYNCCCDAPDTHGLVKCGAAG